MSLPAAKSDVVVPGPFKQRPAAVVPLAVKAKRFDVNAIAIGAVQTVLPPLVVLAIILTIWQVAFSGPEASLPPPSEVWAQSKDLIIDPFFVNGSQDIGLGLRVLV
jgi:nitrate/nitrite transport system permease protein